MSTPSVSTSAVIILRDANNKSLGFLDEDGLAIPVMDTRIVVSNVAPNNNDGRPDGTIYIQTA